jgi:hypothetical protein
MSGTLLDRLYISNYDEMMRTLLLESRIFGVTIYGDGATITNTPLINILVASPNNPSALLEIVDCTSQMAIWGKKDATYLASVVRPYITAIKVHANTRHQKHQAVVDLVQYDGANMSSYPAESLPDIIHSLPSVMGQSMLSLFSSKMFLNW